MALISLKTPSKLQFPVLATKLSNGLLTFCLCTICTEQQIYPCPHNEDEGLVSGVYAFAELKKALEVGYMIDKLHEIIYCKETAMIYKDCINALAMLKVAYSGWPPNIVTDEQKREYIEKFNLQGIMVKLQEIQKTPASKSTYKYILMLCGGVAP